MNFEETKKRILILGIFILVLTFCLPPMCDLLMLSYKQRTKIDSMTNYERLEQYEIQAVEEEKTENLSEPIYGPEFVLEKRSDGTFEVRNGDTDLEFDTFEEVQSYIQWEERQDSVHS